MRKTKAMFPNLSLKPLPKVGNMVSNMMGQNPMPNANANAPANMGYVMLPIVPAQSQPGAMPQFAQPGMPGLGNNGPTHGALPQTVIKNKIMANNQAQAAQAQMQASVGMPMGGMMTPMMANGMAEAFIVLYRMITIIVALIFMLVVVFTTTDIFKYAWNEASQRWKRFYDPNMYNKDTTDVDALRYISATAAEDETYNIFKTQRFVSYIFMIVGIAVIIMGLQIGLFFGMKIWAIFNGRVFNERVQLPMKLLAVILIIVVAGFAIKDVYTQRFTKRVQTSLVEVRTQLSAIRTFIYNNLTKDANFLRALAADDIDMMSKVIVDTLKTKRGNCTDSTKPCDGDVENMIFSMNLYSFLRYQIPTSDPNFENVTKLFTPEGVENRTVDPTMYFYYNQPIYIPNLYPSIREQLGSTPFYPPSGTQTAKQQAAGSRERIMMLNINNKMQDLNTKLTRLHNLASGKVKVGTYLIMVALVVLVFCLVLLGLFLPELMPYLPMVMDTIKGIWRSLWNPHEEAAKKTD
jgi:hypothetical protein